MNWLGFGVKGEGLINVADASSIQRVYQALDEYCRRVQVSSCCLELLQ